ncbi:MAG: hypothetical protein QOG80_1168 [Pseudonocardiales bacterium]|nr:hypothetical protein [Pseudonocardiales bacterium]
MEFWFDYRRVWAGHPWVLVYAVLVVLVLVLAVIGTIVRNPLAILFIPALAGIYVHHMLVMKRVP